MDWSIMGYCVIGQYHAFAARAVEHVDPVARLVFSAAIT